MIYSGFRHFLFLGKQSSMWASQRANPNFVQRKQN